MNAFNFLVQIRTGNQWQTIKVYHTLVKAKAHAKEVSALYPFHGVKVALAPNR
jgi:hypothetical protein